MEQHSDDNFSDDELLVGSHNFAEIVKTRMGVGPQEKKRREAGDDDNDGPAVQEVPTSTQQAFDFAHSMWDIPDAEGEAKKSDGADIEEEQLKKAFAAASSSQKQEFGASLIDKDPADPTVRKAKSFSSKDVWDWFDRVSKRKDVRGRALVKKAQLSMVKKICKRMCDELEGRESGVETSDPLLWMLHGGPGTGKSEVLKLVRELFNRFA